MKITKIIFTFLFIVIQYQSTFAQCFINGETLVCEKSTNQYKVTGGSAPYIWSVTNGATVTPTTGTTVSIKAGSSTFDIIIKDNLGNVKCNTSIEVNERSVLNSFNAYPDKICYDSESAFLEMEGLWTAGSDAKIAFFEGSCDGTLLGKYDFTKVLEVKPLKSTIYFARYEDPPPCNTITACDHDSVIVVKPSEVPDSAIASKYNICLGDSSYLSLLGGYKAPNSIIKWYQDSCNGKFVGRGNNFKVKPKKSTKYFGRYQDSLVCTSATNCEMVEIVVDNSSLSCGFCRAHDSLELIKLFDSLGGPNWTNKTNWKVLRKPINTWYGVTLNSNGCVSEVTLDANNLKGNLFNLDFPEIKDLYLRYNQLSGPIPNFDKLPNLTRLYIDVNQLSGPIPNFDKLPNLAYLSLNLNQLSGPIPNFDKLPNLAQLHLYNNQLSGPIPNFDKLPNLNILYLNRNQLSGPIPNFDKLPNFANLYLDNNQLSGPIPNFDKLPILYHLFLNNNQLSGPIPNFDKLPKLNILYINNNQLSGPIPNFDKLPNLILLYINNNQLSGPIPNFDKLPNLAQLYINNNQFSGPIPNFDKLPNLKLLYMDYNQLSGPIPNFDKLPALLNLYLNNNQLSGCFSSSLKRLCGITYDFSNNLKLPWQGDFKKFCQDSTQIGAPCDDMDAVTINDKIDANCNCVGTKATQSCRAHDSLELIKLFDSLGGPNWINKTNWKVPGKPIDTWYGITLNSNGCVIGINLSKNQLNGSLYNFDFSELQYLNLYASGLIGQIPNFDKLPKLQSLWLLSNRLSGMIPNFSKLLNLDTLSLYSNNLSGSVPDFDSLINLKILDLGRNQLTGTIPNFRALKKLTILSIGGNQLVGTIPDFSNFKELQKLQLSFNNLTGNIPNFSLMPNLRELDLEINKLNGSLPTFNFLNAIEFIRISSNQLTGSVPNFENLLNLESLILDQNLLTDTIPNFNKLKKLKTLGLSNNNLSGSIPRFDSLTSLKILHLRRNNLINTIPSLTNSPDLISIVLDSNNLSGCFPNALKRFCTINYNFSNNPKLPWQGDFKKFCQDSTQYGAQCNDFDSTTFDDRIDVNCNCVGVKSPWPIVCKGGNIHYVALDYKKLESSSFGTTNTPLEKGDWIGIFYRKKDGSYVCTDAQVVGDLTLSGGLQLKACGETSPGADDGFESNEPLYYQVLKGQTTYYANELITSYHERFSLNNGTYPDGYDKFEGSQLISLIKSIRTVDLSSNPDCNAPILLRCGDKLRNQDNRRGTNNTIVYNCIRNKVDGPELIFTFIHADKKDVRIVIDNLQNSGSSDLELFLMDKCDKDHCIAYSAKTGSSPESLIVRDLPAGTYYIIVDGYFGSESTFDISIECGDFPDDDYSVPGGGSGSGGPVINPKNCGDNFTDNTLNGERKKSSYSPCTNRYYPGREKIYTINFNKKGYVYLYVTPIDNDVDVFILDKYAANSCIAESTQSGLEEELVTFPVEANKNYYVIVDEFATDKGCNFKLRYDCYMTSSGGGGGGTSAPCYAKCDTMPKLDCGVEYQGNTALGKACKTHWYPCRKQGAKGNPGKEVIYLFENKTTQDVIFNVYDLKEDLNVYILDTCVGTCYEDWNTKKTGASAEAFIIQAMPPGIYNVIIDTYVSGKESTFKIRLDCSKTSNPCFDIKVPKGLSYISSPIKPTDPAIDFLLPDSKFNGKIDVITNDKMISYAPGFTSLPSSSALSKWSVEDGYKVLSSEASVINVCGELADSAKIKSVIAKEAKGKLFQHYISYPFMYKQNVVTAFGDSAKSFASQVIKFFPDNAQPPLSYNFNSKLGDNFEMEPGIGYVLKVNRDGNFSYRTKEKEYVPNGCDYFKTELRETSSHAWIKIPKYAIQQAIIIGSEVGVFTNTGLLVGSGKYEGENLLITIQGNNVNTNDVEGFNPNEPINLKFYDVESKTEKEMHVIWKTSNLFQENTVFEISLVTMLESNSAEGIQIYPNPAKDLVYIDLRSVNGKVESLSLFNSKGVKLEELKHINQKQIIEYQCNSCPSGIYYIQVNTNQSSSTKKLILIK